MIGSGNVGSILQAQTTYYRAASGANNVSKQNGGRSSDFNVTISGAAQSKLADEQQAGNATQSDSLPVGIKHMLEQMVDDPAYGASYADGYANNVHTACMTFPEFQQAQGTLDAGLSQLQTAWQGIQSEGKSPAQSFAELLKYELTLPKSYWDAQDPGHTMPDIRAFAQAKLDYLQQYLATK